MHSLSCTCRSAHGLTDFNIAGTSIEGTIPESVKHLRFLQRFNMQNTRMFCCNATGAGSCTSAGDPACLPSFLLFDDNSSVPPPFGTDTSDGYYMK